MFKYRTFAPKAIPTAFTDAETRFHAAAKAEESVSGQEYLDIANEAGRNHFGDHFRFINASRGGIQYAAGFILKRIGSDWLHSTFHKIPACLYGDRQVRRKTYNSVNG